MLSPWDAVPYFQSPVESLVTGNGTVQTLIAADPTRIYLAISMIGSSQNVLISTKSNMVNQQGINLASSKPVYEIFQATHGALCNAAWYTNAPTGSFVTVIAQSLYKWPQEGELSETERRIAETIIKGIRHQF